MCLTALIGRLSDVKRNVQNADAAINSGLLVLTKPNLNAVESLSCSSQFAQTPSDAKSTRKCTL